MIELIVLSREKDRTKTFHTRLKKIKAYLTQEIDLETNAGMFKAGELYQIDGEDERLPITILKVNYKSNIILEAFGSNIPNNYQIVKTVKNLLNKLVEIVEEKSEKSGYQKGFNEASRLHKED